MGKNSLYIILLFLVCSRSDAQFAPAAGKIGSTAISFDSSCFVSWATQAEIQRGWRDIRYKDSGYTSVGDASAVIGPARSNGVTSLGDSGLATLYFESGIINGEGFDFAIFENAFNDSFLELAHVEVSANGFDFYRFPSTSLTQTQNQTDAFGPTRPEHIHNLAGKYRMPYGTPFDLSDLDSVFTDLPSVFYYVRVIDVVGSIDTAWGTKDYSGNLINDPFPTPFMSGGFDLDAIGVIHASNTNNIVPKQHEKLQFYWNQQQLLLTSTSIQPNLTIISIAGRTLYDCRTPKRTWEINSLHSGTYILVYGNHKQLLVIP